MQAGQLNTPIEILKKTKGQDANGATAESWLTHVQVWADFRHKSGMSSLQADAVTEAVTASARIHYRTDIDDGMRIRADGMVYSIKAVLPDSNRHEYMDLVCEKVA